MSGRSDSDTLRTASQACIRGGARCIFGKGCLFGEVAGALLLSGEVRLYASGAVQTGLTGQDASVHWSRHNCSCA